MTNQEAIRILNLERDEWDISHCTQLERRAAFNMAIEALKSQELKNVPDTNVGGMISRQAAIDAMCKLMNSWFGGDPKDEKEEIKWVINHLPSVQPEIVPCGDCKHWICHDRRCGYWNHGVKPLEWCCHAERKENR